MNVPVLIPTYNPTERIIEVVRSLISAGFERLIIVDDGSRPECSPIFAALADIPQCTLLHHDVNRGKGRGLKTGFAYILEHIPECCGVVTTDDDGQHSPEDILHCAEKMEQSGRAVLGARDFTGDDVPPRSRFGNNCTRFVFRALCGIRITDTQTGLRALPVSYLPALAKLSGERFEYETNMLLEMKRLGLCTKSLIVVPNHITEQWAAEWLQLYPSANILVATKKDFETRNRKKFCARIATGDYDAVIIGHSQFEKIPVSAERQTAILQQQIDEIMFGIEEAKAAKAERYTIKQLERTRKSLETRLERLNDQSRKDDLVTFEELGVDRVFVDESHYFKNLFLATKMRNVGGIAQTEAQKSSDLFMKCRYLDEITGGRGVIFATGTPISNSMVELYTIQRYLQYSTLQEMGLIHFDDWASDFGETITAIELSPEGSGYRAKTRFAKFFNLPELMSTFKQVADIQTADMLKLPVPKANFHTEVIQPSELQQEMVRGLAKRAELIRGGGVDPKTDNMLRITNDGRKLALDMRLINPLAADDPNGKVATCARNVIRIWEQTQEQRSAQLVFCDLSTPKDDGTFSVYNDLKKKFMEAGIPEEEIAFIHDANTEARKKELFSKVRSGQVRILMGSTQKMGAGTNVQDRLIALHDLDCPWRPSDVGRILRTFKIKKNVEVTDNGKDNF